MTKEQKRPLSRNQPKALTRNLHNPIVEAVLIVIAVLALFVGSAKAESLIVFDPPPGARGVIIEAQYRIGFLIHKNAQNKWRIGETTIQVTSPKSYIVRLNNVLYRSQESVNPSDQHSWSLVTAMVLPQWSGRSLGLKLFNASVSGSVLEMSFPLSPKQAILRGILTEDPGSHKLDFPELIGALVSPNWPELIRIGQEISAPLRSRYDLVVAQNQKALASKLPPSTKIMVSTDEGTSRMICSIGQDMGNCNLIFGRATVIEALDERSGKRPTEVMGDRSGRPRIDI